MQREVALKLLDHAQLSPEEVSRRLDHALNPDYWRDLNPQLSLQGRCDEEIEETSLDNRAIDGLTRSFTEQGYFQTGPLYKTTVVAAMRQSVETLRTEGWPPVFAFVYDPFWSLLRAPSMAKFLSALLGAGYRQAGQVWVHYVNPHSVMAGWRPHFDAHLWKNRVTVWIALSDATLDNGCMYVVRRSAMPPEVIEAFPNGNPIQAADVKSLLQGIRALPAAAGAALGWDSDIMHWGSLYADGGPRISFSQTFMAAGEKPLRDEVPQIEGDGVPDFSQRLYIIAKAIVDYRRFQAMVVRYSDLAARLLDATAATTPCISG